MQKSFSRYTYMKVYSENCRLALIVTFVAMFVTFYLLVKYRNEGPLISRHLSILAAIQVLLFSLIICQPGKVWEIRFSRSYSMSHNWS